MPVHMYVWKVSIIQKMTNKSYKRNITQNKNENSYLIFPSTEKIVCVTNMEGLDDTLGSANHREGTPFTITVSGLRATPLEEFPTNQYFHKKLFPSKKDSTLLANSKLYHNARDISFLSFSLYVPLYFSMYNWVIFLMFQAYICKCL